MSETSGRLHATRDELVALASQARRLVAQPDRIRAGLNPGVVVAPTHGHGMEFAESRPWVVGDDVRNMDWRVTARTGKPHTKLFEAEKDQPWLVLVDQRPSMFFGTRVRFKSVEAARTAALLAWAGHHLGNRIGACVFHGETVSRVSLMRGRRPVLSLIGQLAESDAPTERSGEVMEFDPNQLAEALSRVPRGAAVFIISDFFGINETAWATLFGNVVGMTLIGVQIVDVIEQRAPPPGRYPIRVGKAVREVSIADESDAAAWSDAMEQRRQMLLRRFVSESARFVQIGPSDDSVDILLPVLTRRGTS